jgi:hypothetical protein
MTALDRLRRRVLADLDRAAALAEEIRPPNRALPRALARSRRLARRAHLHLAVIGGEGEGKSTLVNAVTGLDLVPVSEHDPGTVAPVVVAWGRSRRPEYSVQLADGRTVACDPDEFAAYLLQKRNRDNHRGVHRGTVRVRHPLLGRGLRLIDTPGLEGVHEEVSDRSRDFIRTRVDAALAVVRERSYDKLRGLSESLPPGGARIEAFVLNLDAGFWLGHAADLGKAMAGRRAALLEVLAPGSEDVPEVFVLHLPSLSGLRPAPGRFVTAPEHDAEVERFARWLDAYLDEARPRRGLAEAARLASDAVRRVAAARARRAGLISALARGDPRARAEARARHRRAAADVLHHWEAARRHTDLQAAQDAAWAVFVNLLPAAREQIQQAIREHREVVDAVGLLDYSPRMAGQLNNNLEEAWDGACKPLRTAQQEQLSGFLGRLRGPALRCLARADAVFPVPAGELPPQSLSYDRCMAVERADTSVQRFREIWDARVVARRVLDHYQAQLDRADRTPNGREARAFRAGFVHAFEVFDSALKECLDSLGKLAEDPAGSKDRLSTAAREFAGQARRLRACARRLDRLRSLLEQPAEG